MQSVVMEVQYLPRLAEHHHQHTLRVGICCEEEESEPIMEPGCRRSSGTAP